MTYGELIRVINTAELACVNINHTDLNRKTDRFYGTLNAFHKTYGLESIKGYEVCEIGTTLKCDPVDKRMLTVLFILLKD